MLEKLSDRFHGFSGLFIRLGLGFIYLFSGYSKLFAGSDGIGVCSNRAEAVTLVGNYQFLPVDPETFVIVQSVLELLLGIVLVLGLKPRWAGLISTILLILFLVMIDFQLIWKNIALLGASIALVITKEQRWSWNGRLNWFKKTTIS